MSTHEQSETVQLLYKLTPFRVCVVDKGAAASPHPLGCG